MPVRIISSPYSFVRFSNQHLDDADWMERPLPGAGIGFALPVCAMDDLAFQFYVDGETSAEIDTICALDMATQILFNVSAGTSLGPVFTSTDFAAIPNAVVSAAQLGVEKYRLSPTRVLFYVPQVPYNSSLGAAPLDGCFQFAVQFAGQADAVSNVFRYASETDYTTVLDYDSENDEAGFAYCVSPTIHNRVRLPLYLTRPTLPEEETNYRTSSGSTLITKSAVRKVYEVVCDQMPTWALESLRAIWLHKPVEVATSPLIAEPHPPYLGEVVKDGAFEIDWVDYLNYPLGKAKFKVAVSPYLLRKNNCGECTDYSDLFTVQSSVSIGAVAPGVSYTVDLMDYISAACCSPLLFYITYQQSLVATATIGVGGVVTLTTVTPIPSLITSPPLLRIRVTCGGTVKYINIVE